MSTKKLHSTENPRLIVIRHAHRLKPHGSDGDNGLSPKGRRQAARALKFFLKRFGGAKPRIISSPKLRCQETVAPIARKEKVKIQVSPLLDEGGDISRKVRAFKRDWVSAPPELTVISVHGDWAPAFLEEMTGARMELDKGAWAELEVCGGTDIRLRWLVQEF